MILLVIQVVFFAVAMGVMVYTHRRLEDKLALLVYELTEHVDHRQAKLDQKFKEYAHQVASTKNTLERVTDKVYSQHQRIQATLDDPKVARILKEVLDADAVGERRRRRG